MLVAEAAPLILGIQPLEGPVIALPDVEQGQEVRALFAKRGMHGVGLGRLLQGPLARVADAQGGGDDRHLAEGVLLDRLDQHARDARIDRHAGHAPALLGQGVLARRAADGAQLDERVEAVLDRRRGGPVDEGELGGMAEVEGDHPQDDLGQVGAQDLGRREGRPLLIIVLRVEADTDAFGDSAAAAFALVGAALGDRPNGQAVDAGPGQILGDAGQPGVDDIADAGNGQRRLGHVGGHHDLRPVNAVDPPLRGARQTGIERQDGHAGVFASGQALAGLQDILLRGHEDQDVAGPLFPAQIIDGLDGGVDIVGILVRVPLRRPVFDLHRVHPAADLDHRRAWKSRPELLDVQSG